MSAVTNTKNQMKKINTLLNKEGSKCYLLDTNRKFSCKNSIEFNSFELHKKLKSNIITAQYNNERPIYIEDTIGFNITHFKGLIENVKNLKPEIVVINTKRVLDRIYENKLFLELDEVADKHKTQILVEYNYKVIIFHDINLSGGVHNISIRFDSECNIEDISNFLGTSSNIKMVKITEDLFREYIEDTGRFKKILKLLEDTYVIIEGVR